jgi:hypothetical protein
MKTSVVVRTLALLIAVCASPGVSAAPASGEPDRIERGVLVESPRASANRVRYVPGVTADRMVRTPLVESPRASANRVRRVPGVTPDRLDRGVATISPRALNNFPWHRAGR